MKSALLMLAAIAAFAQTQPIPFSHKIHAGDVKLGCDFCHEYPAKFGDPVGIPDAPKCLECHAFAAKPTATLAALNSYVEKKQAIPWVRVFALKNFVYFDHRFHLQNDVHCEDCHGPISTEEVVTDQNGTTKMSFCQPCHVKSRAASGCNTCHDPR
jgi:hypothetical protein